MFNDKNVILFGLVIGQQNNITPMGSLYDALEYFMQIYELNDDVRLLFYKVNMSRGMSVTAKTTVDGIKEQLRDIMEGKYDIYDYSFMDNIHIVDFNKLFLKNKLNKVMTIDLTTPAKMKRYMCRANEVIIVPEWTTDDYYYKSTVNRVTYFTEMPFCRSDTPYKIKMAFDKFKKIGSCDDKLYINYPKQKIEDNPQAVEFIRKNGKEQLIKDDHFFYNIHERFNEYVYFKSDEWFDPHPRLFHECKFYNKQYHYFNPKGVKDGSYYRYYDSLTETVDDRMLTKNDPIVKLMS